MSKSFVSPKPNRANNSATLALLVLDAPAKNQTKGNSAGEDIFSSFSSAPPASVASRSNGTSNTTTNASTTISKSEERSFLDQSAPSPQEKNKTSKNSILVLYVIVLFAKDGCFCIHDECMSASTFFY